ncbi:cytochrome P450 [Sistotremastrum suecicum HHB10207 ss-3]|uniref:Cytochrome P450 n=1 Tax=Sistotremastrum suecicum HHB10207 ss-3 TaxID=1314776 RepID=A0A166F4V1_9AGAM|nr:cytochrome P450 [Sistotremastrum suecicum HHB10207 ss-3]
MSFFLVLSAVAAAFTSFILWRAFKIWDGYKRLGHLPGFYTLCEATTAFGALAPSGSWNLGLSFTWKRKEYLYTQYQSEVIAIFPLLWGNANVYHASPEVLRQIKGINSAFHKSEMGQGSMKIMGPNVVASEGEDWKRQRRITTPAFNGNSYRSVWEESSRIFNEMIKHEGWATEKDALIPDICVYSRKFALLIIASVGFGLPLDWSEPRYDAQGKMSKEEIITQVSMNILPRFVLPWWIYTVFPTKGLRAIDTAYKTIEVLLRNMIDTRADEIRKSMSLNEDLDHQIRDVFGRLVAAQIREGEKLSLNDQEIIGNAFILLFAGHETTAYTLSATLALLALNEEEQEIAYQHIRKTLPDDRLPTFDDYDSLNVVLACFYEGLRMYPAAYLTIREASEDTRLSVPSLKRPGEMETVTIKKGTTIMNDFVGMSYNERIYSNPGKFQPSRWYDTNVDRLTNFGAGPRTCLGMKFATTEATCYLTLLLREWKVEVVLEDGQTKEEWKTKYLTPTLLTTLTLDEVPLRLVKRGL